MTFREQMNKNRTQPTAEELAEKARIQAYNEKRDAEHAAWRKLSNEEKMQVVNESVSGLIPFVEKLFAA